MFNLGDCVCVWLLHCRKVSAVHESGHCGQEEDEDCKDPSPWYLLGQVTSPGYLLGQATSPGYLLVTSPESHCGGSAGITTTVMKDRICGAIMQQNVKLNKNRWNWWNLWKHWSLDLKRFSERERMNYYSQDYSLGSFRVNFSRQLWFKLRQLRFCQTDDEYLLRIKVPECSSSFNLKSFL